jgi:hypothetical protein
MYEEKLIILVQGHECLYNLQHKDYDNNLVKDKIFAWHLLDVQTTCEILLPLLLRATLYEPTVFGFFFRFSSARRQSPQAMITSSSQRSIPAGSRRQGDGMLRHVSGMLATCQPKRYHTQFQEVIRSYQSQMQWPV